jgi:hypothetical protein
VRPLSLDLAGSTALYLPEPFWWKGVWCVGFVIVIVIEW